MAHRQTVGPKKARQRGSAKGAFEIYLCIPGAPPREGGFPGTQADETTWSWDVPPAWEEAGFSEYLLLREREAAHVVVLGPNLLSDCWGPASVHHPEQALETERTGSGCESAL